MWYNIVFIACLTVRLETIKVSFCLFVTYDVGSENSAYCYKLDLYLMHIELS